jgi:hypothetical protein
MDDRERLRRMYGKDLPWLVVLSMAFTLGIGIAFRVAQGRHPFEDSVFLVGLTLGVGAGCVVSAFLIRRHRRR